VPYRIDLHDPPENALDILVELGALDVEAASGGLAAIVPDTVSAHAIATALGVRDVRVSPAAGRDDDSVWTLIPRPVRVGSLVVAPAGVDAPPGALKMIDGPAFGTGLHLTTALCVEAVEQIVEAERVEQILDVGTGSGILALAALMRGVPRAVGLDIERDALRVARDNARLNGLAGNLTLILGGPDAVRGAWPLVVANIRAAELMAMASTLVRRIASRGRLVLSGVPSGVAADVERIYRRLGLTPAGSHERGGWTALVFRPTW
jgi:ribosomal protein L11 methyltransferase